IAALNPDSFPGTRSLASGIIKDTSGIYSMDDLENLFSGYAEASETMGFARALARFARPGLKNVLDTLMPDKAGIASPAELTDYLYKLSGEKIFTSTQVLKALAAMAHESDMKEFIEGLKIHSAPDLNKIITRYVEPAELKSPNELVDYLLENHPTYESELKDGLTNLARETYLHYLLDKMIKMSEGNLRELLQYLKSNLENENITDLSGIIQYLLNNAGQHEISKQDIIQLLLGLTQTMMDPDEIFDHPGVPADEDTGQPGKYLTPVITWVGLTIILILFFIFYRKSRKKRK
ncbi:MAG: hypothetical protein ACOC2F_00840, partial [Bacteroidota bacterium]